MKTAVSLLVTITVALCLVAAPCMAADVAKIGVVDIQKVLHTSAAGKSAKAEINKKAREMEGLLNDKKGEIEKLQADLERESLVMSKEKRDERQREIRIKVNDIKALKEKFEKDLKVMEGQVIKRIQKEFESIAQAMGKEQGYLLIITNPVVVYSPNSIDITDELIQKYDAVYKEKGGSFDFQLNP
ncbi:MAG: OmpH family outer membrane protein [Deltaproteobacteria bacterium]|nr:OmpH family outer membrane protein [Deltaproteobacteria bacterium]